MVVLSCIKINKNFINLSRKLIFLKKATPCSSDTRKVGCVVVIQQIKSSKQVVIIGTVYIVDRLMLFWEGSREVVLVLFEQKKKTNKWDYSALIQTSYKKTINRNG